MLNLRGKKVKFDFDLAEMYQVETRVLKQAVRRNIEKFPEDFMFELTESELENLRSQNVMASWGGLRHLPFAFTEQGLAILSSVLKSKTALQINITIMRALVTKRQYQLDSKDLKEKIESLETEMQLKFKNIHHALKYLLSAPNDRKRIGFKQ